MLSGQHPGRRNKAYHAIHHGSFGPGRRVGPQTGLLEVREDPSRSTFFSWLIRRFRALGSVACSCSGLCPSTFDLKVKASPAKERFFINIHVTSVLGMSSDFPCSLGHSIARSTVDSSQTHLHRSQGQWCRSLLTEVVNMEQSQSASVKKQPICFTICLGAFPYLRISHNARCRFENKIRVMIDPQQSLP